MTVTQQETGSGGCIGRICLTTEEQYEIRRAVESVVGPPGPPDAKDWDDIAWAVVRAAELGNRRGVTDAFALVNRWWAGLTPQERAELASAEQLVDLRVRA